MNISFYSAVFAVWFVLLALAVIVGWSPSQDVVAFLTAGGLAGYMQGVGTIVAAVFAVLAYRSWRRPDDARRVADAAQLLIRESKKLEARVQNTRGLAYTIGDEPRTVERKVTQLRELLSASDQSDRAALHAAIEAFELYGAEVEGLFDQRVSEAFTMFTDRCQGVLVAFSFGSSYYNLANAQAHEKHLDDILNVVGLRGSIIEPESATVTRDPFGDELKQCGDMLRRSLHPHLVKRD